MKALCTITHQLSTKSLHSQASPYNIKLKFMEEKFNSDQNFSARRNFCNRRELHQQKWRLDMTKSRWKWIFILRFWILRHLVYIQLNCQNISVVVDSRMTALDKKKVYTFITWNVYKSSYCKISTVLLFSIHENAVHGVIS